MVFESDTNLMNELPDRTAHGPDAEACNPGRCGKI